MRRKLEKVRGDSTLDSTLGVSGITYPALGLFRDVLPVAEVSCALAVAAMISKASQANYWNSFSIMEVPSARR
jgi:hypothetical protein